MWHQFTGNISGIPLVLWDIEGEAHGISHIYILIKCCFLLQLDILEDSIIKNVVILQTVLEEV